jgi:3-phenylpropionate/trans-cinnamate dioxygenase ferredoxin subunit
VNWVKIFDHADEAKRVVGEEVPQLLVVHGRRICLARYGTEWFAVSDVCTHNGESLSKGHINFRREIICPWHGYTFDLKTGRECAERSADLEVFPIRQTEDGLFIGL